jgi:drug/metabolite transporter (DMT)-like permease
MAANHATATSAARGEALAMAALVSGAICIGFAPLWVRLSEVGPVATAFYRLAIALPALALWAAAEPPRSSGPMTRRDHVWGLASGAFFAVDLAAWHLSIRLTSVANATLLANLAPIFVTAGAWIFLHERVHRRFYIGLVLSLAGAWFLTGASLSADPARVRGDALGCLTALFYGGYQLCVARLRRRFGPGRVLFVSSMVGAPLLLLIAAALDEKLLPASSAGWAVLAGLALTSQLMGQGLITHGFGRLPASHSSITLLVQPLVAAIVAWIFLRETVSVGQVVGGIALLAGILIARRTPVAS